MPTTSKKRIVQIKNVRPRDLTAGRRRGIQGTRSDIDELLFQGRRFRGKVSDAILSADLTRSIDSASRISMTLADDKRELVTRPLFQTQFDLELDNLWFRLQSINDQGDDLELGFEARDVNRLRRQTGHLKVLRKQLTRAEFILLMVRELKRPVVPFFSPQLHVIQPIRSRREHRSVRKTKDEQREPGLGAGANVTVKGVRASAEQIRNINIILDTAMSLGASFRVMSMAIACATQENNMSNNNPGDEAGPDSRGLYGQRLQYYPNAEDPVAATRYFLVSDISEPGGMIGFDQRNPDMNFSLAIAALQKPNAAYVMEYQQWKEEANNTVKAYLGGTEAGTATFEVEKKIPYAFERKKEENSWAAMTRLANEVRWRCFESNGLVYYVSDDYLLRSRVRALITPDSPGIDEIKATYHGNKKVEEATITGRAREWAAPPGTVAQIGGRGKANGRWLVHEIKSSLFTDDFEATLKRPMEPLPEPPPKTKTITRSVNVGPGGGGASAQALEQVNIVNRSPGAPHWGGTFAVFNQFIIPFMEEQGLGDYTDKRPENTGSGISDHWDQSTSAFACDFGTFSGETAARKLAAAMGYSSWSPDSYTSFTIRVDGLTFSCQILWGSGIDHGDHVHVGIHRA